MPFPTTEQVEEQHTEALVRSAEGTRTYPGMSYDEGVRDALAWVLGERDVDEPPLPT